MTPILTKEERGKGSTRAIETTPATVAVIGLGYVGLPLAVLSRARGYEVAGIDIDPRRGERIRQGAVPDLDDTTAAHLRGAPLSVSDQYAAVREADIVIICVPTPVDEAHEPDLTPVRDATENVARHLREGHLVVLESTVHPGTCEEIMIPILERVSGLTAGVDFGVAHCPERINPGDKRWPLQKIPRVVGATDADSLSRAAWFYRSILEASVREMRSLKEAEAVKVVENSFRDINIAFVNELAMSFSKLGIDVVHVLEAAATKPFGFMLHYPGCGVGGHCIPVDPYYLIRHAQKNGFSHKFLSMAREINESMPAFTVARLENALAAQGMTLAGATVTVLGLSYKADVADLRESPSFHIIALLEEKGATVRTFDPHALDKSTVRSFSQALAGADAALIATAHRYFSSLTPRSFLKHGVRIVVDGRNCLDKDAFLSSEVVYRGIGR